MSEDSDEDPLLKHSRERASKRRSRKFDDAGICEAFCVCYNIKVCHFDFGHCIEGCARHSGNFDFNNLSRQALLHFVFPVTWVKYIIVMKVL